MEDEQYEYALTENDLINWRRTLKGQQPLANRDSILPYRTHEIRVETKPEYLNRAKQRLYHCFGDIGITKRVLSSGKQHSDLSWSLPFWRPLLMQSMWNGVASLDTDIRIPRDFVNVPVMGMGPLARAARPGRNSWAYYEGLGMSQSQFYWAAVLVQDKYIGNDGEEKVYEGPAILQMKAGQALALAEKVDEEREDHPNFNFVGCPFSIWQEEDKKYKVRLWKGKERKNMAQVVAPDLDRQISAIVLGLDKFLTKNGAQIAGFPYKSSHEDDGWRSDIPYADTYYKERDLKGMTKDEMDGLGEFLPEETEKTDDESEGNGIDGKFLRMSNDDLRDFLDSLGVSVPSRAKREDLLKKIEESMTKDMA